MAGCGAAPTTRTASKPGWKFTRPRTPPFETALADAVRDAGIAALIDGPRHIEVFTDSSPCA